MDMFLKNHKTLARTAAVSVLLSGLAVFSFAASANFKLNYQGYIKSNGAPVNGTKGFTFRVRDGAGGAIHWESSCTNITVSSGSFRATLGDTNAVGNWGAINWSGVDAHLEIVIGDQDTCANPTTLSPPERLTGSIYSLYASSASKVITREVPSAAVMYFNSASCPSGWTEFTAARGFYLVGLPSGGTLNAVVGTALTDMENRAVGQHTHTVTDPGHLHTSARSGTGGNGNMTPIAGGSASGSTGSSTTGVTVNNSGIVAGTVAPYVQLIVCKKN